MTSQAQAAAPLAGVRGLAFLGFPLHPAGRVSAERRRHLADVHVPMLFLQGTRDELASYSWAGSRSQARAHGSKGIWHGLRGVTGPLR